MPTPSFTHIIHSSNPREARSRRLYRLGRVAAIDGDLAAVAVDKDDAGQDLTIDSVQVAAPWSAQVGDWVDIAYLDDTPQSPFIRSILFSDTHDPATYMPRGRHDHLGDEARPFKTLCPSDSAQWIAQYVEGSTAYLVSNLPELHIRAAAQIKAATILPVSGSACDLGSSAARWRAAYLADQLSSSVSSGTAPFVIASPTLVSNLNADMTDGQHLGTSDAPRFARLGVAVQADANIPLSIFCSDATQLQLLRSTGPNRGASLYAGGAQGVMYGAANAYFDGANWQRYSTAYPVWMSVLDTNQDALRILRAGAGENPATFSALLTLNSGGNLLASGTGQFTRLGVAAAADAGIPLTVLRQDAAQLQLLRASGQGASVMTYGVFGRLWDCANAFLAGAWASYNSSYPSWIYGAEPDFDRFIIYRAPAAANPSFSILMAVDSTKLCPGAAAGLNLGDASYYWNDVNHKSLIDRGCLFWADMFEGGDLTALAKIKKDPARFTIHGLPALDYASLPSPAYRPAPIAQEDIYETDPMTAERKLKFRAGEKMGEDGADLNALISIMLGAIKELDSKVQALSARLPSA
jgi:hypothetical protein